MMEEAIVSILRMKYMIFSCRTQKRIVPAMQRINNLRVSRTMMLLVSASKTLNLKRFIFITIWNSDDIGSISLKDPMESKKYRLL
jgi:hypothetical protein